MELREKMAEMGYFGILIPEDYGGLGLGSFEYCLITEELSRAWMSVGSIIRNSTVGGLFPISMLTPDQREKYVRRMAAGNTLLPSLCRSPIQVLTYPISLAALFAMAIPGCLLGANTGARSPTPPTASS